MHEMELPEGLLAVGRAGAGVNNIPLDECAKAGVVVFNTPGANANGVKELVLAGMFLASRDIVGGIKWCQDNAQDENIAKTTKHLHTEIRNKKAATCGETGYTGDTYCTDCGTKISSGKTIAKLTTHTWDEGKVTKEPTCTVKGVRTFTCSICAKTKTSEHCSNRTSAY